MKIRFCKVYPYGLIGNCQVCALVDVKGSVGWMCAPYPDSPPVFGKLLDPQGGEFVIESVAPAQWDQRYLPNTNILSTTITSGQGAFRVTDFCPRFDQHGRVYRPVALFRIVEPVGGNPVVRVKCRPVDGWGKRPVVPIRGNSHLRFEIRKECLRVATSMSLTHLVDETSFELSEPIYFGLTWGVGIEDDLPRVAREFLDRTVRYWLGWVKHCSIPSIFQKETIRSALALKLHCFEDTGAIIAAPTTSLPEELLAGRNWDYRYCWLRDAYFTLSALHRIGHFEETEGFLKFLLGIVHSFDRVKPVYRIDGTLPLPEYIHDGWQGFGRSVPVRSNNEAATHIQNDVFGEMILALAPIYLDERFQHLRTPEHERLIEHLAVQCGESIAKPDAGLWEIRNGMVEHSFTNLMCWAGLDRVTKLASLGFLKEMTLDAVAARMRAERAVLRAVSDGIIRNGPHDPSLDAAILQAPILRFPDKELCRKTVNACYEALRLGTEGNAKYFLYRYRNPDDFGVPQSAFVFCSFWWVQALASLQKIEAGRELLENILVAANHVGLISEHYEPISGTQLGNFPQGYSHVGAINAAFAVSPSWDEVL